MLGSRPCWMSGGKGRSCSSPSNSCGHACWFPYTCPIKTPPSLSWQVILLHPMLHCPPCAAPIAPCMSCCLYSSCLHLAFGCMPESGIRCVVARGAVVQYVCPAVVRDTHICLSRITVQLYQQFTHGISNVFAVLAPWWLSVFCTMQVKAY